MFAKVCESRHVASEGSLGRVSGVSQPTLLCFTDNLLNQIQVRSKRTEWRWVFHLRFWFEQMLQKLNKGGLTVVLLVLLAYFKVCLTPELEYTWSQPIRTFLYKPLFSFWGHRIISTYSLKPSALNLQLLKTLASAKPSHRGLELFQLLTIWLDRIWPGIRPRPPNLAPTGTFKL